MERRGAARAAASDDHHMFVLLIDLIDRDRFARWDTVNDRLPTTHSPRMTLCSPHADLQAFFFPPNSLDRAFR
jgi:hypothetical protein